MPGKKPKCSVCGKNGPAFSSGKHYCDPCLKAKIDSALAWDDICWSLGIGRWGQ